MKNPRQRFLDLTTVLGMTLALGALAPPAASRPANDTLDLHAVLESARAAAQRDAWQQLEHGLLLEGTTDAGGVDSSFELYLTADGRYRFEMDGRMARTLTFDGQDAALRVRSGPSLLLGAGERESWHYAQWISSGYWLEPTCPIRVELADATANAATDAVTLHLAFPDSTTSARLVLDRERWLPRELHQTALGGDMVTRFGQYETIEGIPMARLVRSEGIGEDSELRVHEMGAAPTNPGARYERGAAQATDVHFDRERSPDVEVKRARTGHLLVHPLVNGKDVGWFILDSGAGQICIDPGVADELDLERFGSVPAVGVAGAVEASFRQGASLALGPLRIDDPVFVEIELAFMTPAFGVELAGICGFDVFARSVVALELDGPSLSLFDPSTFDLGQDAWSPLVIDQGVPGMRCRFEGDREGLFKLDLGDTGSITFYTPAVQSLGLLEGREVFPSQVAGVGGAGKASEGDLQWFEIAGRRFEPLRVTFSQTETGVFASDHALGNIGTHMLRSFLIVFDYSNARIALIEDGD